MPLRMPSICCTVTSFTYGCAVATDGSRVPRVSVSLSVPWSTSLSTCVATNVFVTEPIREWSTFLAAAPPTWALPADTTAQPFVGSQIPTHTPGTEPPVAVM
jgi:hypothetical protein